MYFTVLYNAVCNGMTAFISVFWQDLLRSSVVGFILEQVFQYMFSYENVACWIKKAKNLD